MTNRRRRSLRLAIREQLRRWLVSEPVIQGRTIRFEPLETRELLAADFFNSANLLSGQSNGLDDDREAEMATSSQLVAEGEAQDDLVAFAKALRDAGVKFFGAIWCPHCNATKQLFQDGAKYLPFIEVTNPDRTPNSIGIAENITEYPTWQFQDGSRLTGEQSLATISQRAGIAIPKSSTPSVDAIPNQTVLIGSPLHIPVDAYDPNGNPLTITVTSSNPSLVTAEVLQGNKSLRMNVEGYGDMVFELFDQEAARAVDRIVQLTNSGFYNKTASNKITFHRVVNNFVIQGGDPTGTGGGGSTLGDFDDHFNVNLQHNRTGVLSFAKSTDDTNDSQFFITEGPQRHLDFNHSVFGQLIEGETVREGISNTAVSNSRPTNEVVINSMTIFDDTENGLIRLKAAGNQTGSATITVTVTDTEGNSVSQTFVATVAQDTIDSHPFLNDISPLSTPQNTPITFQLTSQDAEGNPVFYDANNPTSVNYQFSIDNTTGQVTVTPPSGFVGTMKLRVGVRAEGAGNTEDQFDRQEVSIEVTSNAPTSLDLQPESDSGASATDNITNASSLTFVVNGTSNGATVEILNGTTVIGTAVATGTSTTITTNNISTLGSGTYNLTARQTTGGTASGSSPVLQVIYDATAPTQIPASTFPATIPAGQKMQLNLTHTEEGNGLIYALQNAPAGLGINASTGVLEWTPTAAQQGNQSFTLVLTDTAGNTTSQTIQLAVADVAQAGIALRVVDLDGNPIDSIAIGQSFKLQIFVEDFRPNAEGVFGAYMDLLYDNAHIQLDGDNAITRIAPYLNAVSGNTSTPGLIDEFGAFGPTTPVGEGQKLFAEIRFKATSAGQANFSSNDAETNGNDLLVFGLSSPIAPERVAFGTATVTVGNNFVVTNDIFNFNEDSSNNTLDVLANDTVVPGSNTVLTIQSVSTTTAGGTAVISADGKHIIYTPKPNYTGNDAFVYRAGDQSGASAFGTVTIQVQPVNDPPVAVNDAVEVTGNTTQNLLTVLTNDNSGPDTNETLTITAVGTPSQGGTVTIGASGLHLLYTPKNGFVGSETFTYTIKDNGGATTTATVTVTVKEPVPPPTAVNDAFTVIEDAASATFDVLVNDTPAEVGQSLSVTAVTASHGTVSVASNNQSINYAPKPNFNGTDIVIYTVRSSNGGTATGTATFTVTAVNDPPNAADDSMQVASALATTELDVLANDINPDANENQTITAVTQPGSGQGTVAISGDAKTIIYTPPSNSFAGTVTFTYTLSDGTGLTDTATVTLTVSSFTPRTLSGSILNSGASSLFAFDVGDALLTGQDYLSQQVNKTVDISSGNFAVPNLAPGTYQITTQALPFMVGSQPVTVESDIDDGDMSGIQLNVGTLDARFIDIRDFLNTTIGRGIFVATAPGQSQRWVASQGDWKNFKDIQVTLNENMTSLQLRAINASNTTVQTTIPLNGTQASIRATSGNDHLLRILPSPSQLTLTPVSSSSGSGEGEGSSPQALAAPDDYLSHNAVFDSLGNGLVGEGEDDGYGKDAVDTAMQSVSDRMILISPAGDFIAEQHASEGIGQSDGDSEATDDPLSPSLAN